MSNTLNWITTRRVGVWLVYSALALAAFVFLSRTFLPSLTAMTHSYPSYYLASRLVVQGRWTPQVYDDAWYSAQLLELTNGQISDAYSVQPPPTAFLFVPIAWLDLIPSRIVWQFLNLALLISAVGLLWNALAIRDPMWRALVLAGAFLFPPVRENFRVAQVYVLMLFLFALALWSELRAQSVPHQRAWVTGLALAIAMSFKLSGALLWVMLAARARWRTLFAAAVVTVGIAIFSFLLLGARVWQIFFARALGVANQGPIGAHVAYQTTPSFFQHLFTVSTAYNPTPLFNAPSLVIPLTLITALFAIGIMVYVCRAAPIELAFAAAVTLSVIFFPLAIEYHYPLLLLPLAVMGARVLAARKTMDTLVCALILLLMYLPINWNDPFWNEPAWTLFAYPRLYGGWVLWLWLLKQMLSPSAARRVSPLGATQ